MTNPLENQQKVKPKYKQNIDDQVNIQTQQGMELLQDEYKAIEVVHSDELDLEKDQQEVNIKNVDTLFRINEINEEIKVDRGNVSYYDQIRHEQQPQNISRQGLSQSSQDISNPNPNQQQRENMIVQAQNQPNSSIQNHNGSNNTNQDQDRRQSSSDPIYTSPEVLPLQSKKIQKKQKNQRISNTDRSNQTLEFIIKRIFIAKGLKTRCKQYQKLIKQKFGMELRDFLNDYVEGNMNTIYDQYYRLRQCIKYKYNFNQKSLEQQQIDGCRKFLKDNGKLISETLNERLESQFDNKFKNLQALAQSQIDDAYDNILKKLEQ